MARQPKPRPPKKPTDRSLKNLRPFKSGSEWNGNAAGRPKGSRNKLCEDFIKALADDFAESGIEAIKQARADRPAQYIAIIAGLLPKDLTVVNKTHEEWLAELG